jgi:hypothetical protein
MPIRAAGGGRGDRRRRRVTFLVRELRHAAGRPDGRRRRALACLALLLGAAVATPAPALPESARCADLRAQIARAGADATARRYRAAAEKLRGEYGKLAAKGRAMGCDREQFLFFGEPPPPQCGPLNARINALRGSIEANERAASDDSQRQALSARYDAECRNAGRGAGASQEPKNFFEELFGLDASEEPPEARQQSPSDYGVPDPWVEDNHEDGRLGGSTAICVRDCDGGFFPAGFHANSANLDDLNRLCKALCPNASVKLYTRSQWRSLDDAVSIDGARYSEHPNAFKFQTSYDPACGCKPPGKNWAEVLADAEAILAERYAKDHVVTEEQAEEMSRPLKPGEVRTPKRAQRAGAAPSPATQTPTVRFDNGTGDPAVYKDVTGSDGVTRRVRVIAPTM